MARWPSAGEVFLGAFALLVAGAAPGLYLRDSGELTTAAFSLGVAHETGFPLYCLLGKAVSLVPLGEVATRLTLLSAASGAAAAALVHRLVGALLRDDEDSAVRALASLTGAALLIFAYTFWKQATVAEVYAPTAAALALALLLCTRAAAGDRRAGLALFLVAGLALGLHASFRLLLLPPLVLGAAWRLRRGDRWPLLAPLLFAVGASVLAYLPVAAARDPVADFGDPRTLGRLIDHLAAARIRRAFADQILSRDVGRVLRAGAAFLTLVEEQLGAPALALAALGLAWLSRRRRPVGLLCAALAVGETIYAAWINPMGQQVVSYELVSTDFWRIYQDKRANSKSAQMMTDPDVDPELSGPTFDRRGDMNIKLSADDEMKAYKELTRMRALGPRYAQTVGRVRLLKMASGIRSIPGKQLRPYPLTLTGFRDPLDARSRVKAAASTETSMYGRPADETAFATPEEMHEAGVNEGDDEGRNIGEHDAAPVAGQTSREFTPEELQQMGL